MLALVVTTLDPVPLLAKFRTRSAPGSRQVGQSGMRDRVFAVEVTDARVAHRLCSHGMHLGPHTKCGTSCQNEAHSAAEFLRHA